MTTTQLIAQILTADRHNTFQFLIDEIVDTVDNSSVNPAPLDAHDMLDAITTAIVQNADLRRNIRAKIEFSRKDR